jgi:hypothetical protein
MKVWIMHTAPVFFVSRNPDTSTVKKCEDKEKRVKKEKKVFLTIQSNSNQVL